MAKYKQTKLTKYFKGGSVYGKSKKDYKFKKSYVKNSGLRRKFEFDLQVKSFNNQITLDINAATQLLYINYALELNNSPEFQAIKSQYVFYRIRGIAVKWCTIGVDIPPFAVTVIPANISTPAQQTAFFSDDRLETDGSYGGPVSKYWNFQGSAFMNAGGYTIGGPNWQTCEGYDPNRIPLNLLVGQSVGLTKPNGQVFGTLRVKLYLDFCKPIY